MWMAIYLIIIIIISLWLISSPFYWKTKKIPYLMPIPIFGTSLQLFFLGTNDFIMYLYDKFPGEKYFGIHLLTRPALFIKDPKLMERIFKQDFDYFSSHGFYTNQERDPSGGNVFAIHGEQWKETRRKLTKLFTPAKIKSVLPCLNNSITKLFVTIDENIEKNNVMDVRHLFYYLSIDNTIQIMFGNNSDLEKEKSIFRELARKSLTASFFLRMLTALISSKLFDLFKFTYFKAGINSISKIIVEDSIELRNKQNIVSNDLLQGLIGLMNTKPSSDEKYFPDNTRVPKYDVDFVVSQLLALYEGSVQTTTNLLSFLFYELALHDEIQKKCRDEINSVVREGTEINAEHLMQLTYLNAVIKETMRLHSPFIAINRECTKTYKVPDSDLIIDKGTLIFTSPAASHLQEEYFPEPKQFRPERFLNEHNDDKKPGTTYFPFGDGPRICIGMSLGLFASKFIVAKLLQRYEFSTCSKTQIPIKYSKFAVITLPANRIWLKVKKI